MKPSSGKCGDAKVPAPSTWTRFSQARQRTPSDQLHTTRGDTQPTRHEIRAYGATAKAKRRRRATWEAHRELYPEKRAKRQFEWRDASSPAHGKSFSDRRAPR